MRGPPLALVAVLALVPYVAANAQADRGPALLPELRVEGTAAAVSAAELAVGAHLRTGTYFRLAALGALGRAWSDGVAATRARLELQGRFHLDPLREARLGLYGIGGVAATHDPFLDWQARLVVGAGLELPAHERATWAIELALAGGLRFSVVARRLELGRR